MDLERQDPFLGRSFVTNGAYMSILLLQFVLYFFNFACVPIYNVIGEQIYNVPLTTVSLCLTLVYIVATIVGCVSGPVINRLGRMRTLVIAIVLMIVGFAGSAIFIKSGFGVLTFLPACSLLVLPLYIRQSTTLRQMRCRSRRMVVA